MRLKCIKLAGFKSFVDPTTVNFPSNLCAVVGPNGCGKSNIIDAVRWVMGESSARNLRGESMADVIFNGSVNRKPVGQASIELIFDNAGGGLGGEYAAFAEISIKRRVSRDGQSDYFLNGQKCRRRDITDIFLGTGLGPRSYAIIEQGMISRLIEARPEELRVFIEEAAGISRYKERRRETESRMRRTQENLERLTDLREELERQLAHLERQAQAAERYTELKNTERLLRAQLQALQWRTLDEQVREREQAIGEHEVRLEAVIHERLAIDNAIEKHREEHVELNDRFNEVQGRFYALGADIARTEQGIQHQQERKRQLQQDLVQVQRDLNEVQAHLDTDQSRQQQWRSELEELEPEWEQREEQAEAAAERLAVAEEEMQGWQQRWDEFNQQAAAPRQQAEVQQSRLQHLEQALRRIQERIQRLEKEKSDLLAVTDDEDITLLQEQLAELELQIEARQGHSETLREELVTLREVNRQRSSELDKARGALQQVNGRRASLEALQQAALGQEQGQINAWLESQGLAGTARLGEQLKVEEGWAIAVETVLGEHLQAVCVEALEPLAAAVSTLAEGTLQLLEPGAEGQPGPTEEWLAARVEGPGAATLLAGIRTAGDLAEALALRPHLQAHESIVTRDGVWLGRHWVRVSRGTEHSEGVLERQRELERLSGQALELEQQIAVEQQALEQDRERQRTLEAERDRAGQDVQQLSRRDSELRAQCSAQQVRIEQLAARRNRLNREIDEAREQFQIEQENLSEARLLLAEAIERMEIDSHQQEVLREEREHSRDRLEEARQHARQVREQGHQLAMRRQSLCTQLEAVTDSLERTRLRVEQLREREMAIQDQLGSGNEPLAALEVSLEDLLEQRLAVEDELSRARRELEAVDHALRNAEQTRHGVEQRTQDVRSTLERLRLESQALSVRRRTLEDQLQESRFDLQTVLANLQKEATEDHWQEQLEAVGRRIARLGPINLAAIDEYKLQSERKQHLDAQNDELVEALATLESAIRRIDRETRNRFRETFEQVNSGLGELFPRVFGGGSAYLELTGDDMLDTGITIMARPPGKRNSTIHLLSGGEKALTAIALVFSIFRLNPAPFCMLDEVDAPLDDANVGRYARMVKEMSEQVQFIYITHNKIAMEMADQLLGVTMNEPGVSRLVTVDVEEAAELAVS